MMNVALKQNVNYGFIQIYRLDINTPVEQYKEVDF